MLPFAGATIAILIFVVHMTISPNFAVGGSYLVAILVASRFARTLGVALTVLLCTGFLLVATYFGVENPISAAIRISVIGIGTYLVVKARSAEDAARRSKAEWREVFENSQVTPRERFCR